MQIVEELEKLKVEKITMNSSGELKIKFNRPILDLPLKIEENQQRLRHLKQAHFHIEDLFRVSVEDAEEFGEEEKFIKSLTYKKVEREASQEISIFIEFTDYRAISTDIRDPDFLIVELLRPELIVDA